jgi:hypothetical protein
MTHAGYFVFCTLNFCYALFVIDDHFLPWLEFDNALDLYPVHISYGISAEPSFQGTCPHESFLTLQAFPPKSPASFIYESILPFDAMF